MANNAAAATALKLLREVEKQARKTMREPGDSRQEITLRAHIYIKQDKTGKVNIGGSIATNLPTEPVGGDVEGGWESSHETGVVGYVELEKVITLEG